MCLARRGGEPGNSNAVGGNRRRAMEQQLLTEGYDMTLQADIRAAISNAYYEARNHGQTMEVAADNAATSVMAVLSEAKATL